MNTDGNTMKRVIRTVIMLTAAAFAATGCAVGPRSPEVPEMDVTFAPQKGDFLALDGSRLSLQTVVEGLEGADYVVIGEGHTNACDHKMQQALLQGLSRNGRPLSLGLEMIGVDKQPVLDDFGKGQVRVEALEEELDWKKRWGYPFELFRGHFELAEKRCLPVAGINVPPDVVRKVSEEGVEKLDSLEASYMPEEVVMPPQEQRDSLMEVLALHEGGDEADEERAERFLYIQSVWDSMMAEQAVKLRARYDWPVVLVAGGGHVEYGWGIPDRIRRLDPDAVVMTVMPWRGREYDPDAADYSFYCPSSYESRLGATLVRGARGVYVESVKRDSRAYRSGLRPNMVIVKAQGIPVKELFDIHRAGKKAHDNDASLIFTTRLGGEEYTLDFGPLGSRNSKEQNK